jgi:ATP-dependent HslUV protease ATP-binding subunit HslU
LDKEDFKRILTQPKNALIKQYEALLATEGIHLEFTKDAVERIAEIAYMVNQKTEDIGARRLHTVMERVLEEILYNCPDLSTTHIKIDSKYVEEKLKDVVEDEDLSRYIL